MKTRHFASTRWKSGSCSLTARSERPLPLELLAGAQLAGLAMERCLWTITALTCSASRHTGTGVTEFEAEESTPPALTLPFSTAASEEAVATAVAVAGCSIDG